MKLSDDTGQARAAAILAPVPDAPVRIDTAMRRRAAEYTGPATPDDPGGRDWWRKVRLMAAHH